MFADLDPVNPGHYQGSTPSDDITAVSYSPDGNYLATGNRAGKLSLLRIEKSRKSKSNVNWIPYFQYQSHVPEFDFLKSLEIEAKINQIRFLGHGRRNQLMLSCNDKTIKLWQVGTTSPEYECSSAATYRRTGKLVLPKRRNKFEDLSLKDFDDSPRDPAALMKRISNRSSSSSMLDDDDSLLSASMKKVFADSHAYHIHSLETHSDGTSFFSADDLRINWWNLERPDTCFNFVDIKPADMNDLSEVITSVHMHPSESNMLAYSSSRGIIKVCDTRISATCSSYGKTFSDTSATNTTERGSKSFINDIINSISDFKFSNDGRFMVSRDYMSIKLWDLTMDSKPIKVIPVHSHLRPHLYDLYSSDTIFDKFEVCCSADGQSFASGSYSNQLKIFSADGAQKKLLTVDLPVDVGSVYEGDTVPTRSVPTSSALENDFSQTTARAGRSDKLRKRFGLSPNNSGLAPELLGTVRTDEKVLHCAWHPTDSTLAVVSRAGLCLYNL